MLRNSEGINRARVPSILHHTCVSSCEHTRMHKSIQYLEPAKEHEHDEEHREERCIMQQSALSARAAEHKKAVLTLCAQEAS